MIGILLGGLEHEIYLKKNKKHGNVIIPTGNL
jgi:hypothetical protein